MSNPTKLPINPRFLAHVIEKVLGLSVLGDIYDRRPLNSNSKDFLRYTLDELGVTNVIKQEQNIQEIPSQGPVLIIANHPLGGWKAKRSRMKMLGPDLRVLTNKLLRLIPELSQLFIGLMSFLKCCWN